MSNIRFLALLPAMLWFTVIAHAQVPPAPDPDQERMLASPDPALAANKRLVYNFWREVFEAHHMELAPRYLTEAYIQHNPNVPSGRSAFVDFFSKTGPATPIEKRIARPLVTIVAERDLVTLVFAREYDDPKEAGKKYTTTWFDMFRIKDGKIDEHWDPAIKPR
ncbi:nuclear transport factor 2 family protein [Cupriavidus basilensis]